MHRILFAFALMVTVSGCASHVELKDVVASWKGSSIDVAIKKWGYPTKEKTILGQKAYMWALDVKPSALRDLTKWDAPSLEEKYCYCILEVDDKNMIIDAQLDGTECP